MSDKKKPKISTELLQPDKTLALITGPNPISRTQAMKVVWDYIKANKFQDKQHINNDERLKLLFGEARTHILHIPKHIHQHLKLETAVQAAVQEAV